MQPDGEDAEMLHRRENRTKTRKNHGILAWREIVLREIKREVKEKRKKKRKRRLIGRKSTGLGQTKALTARCNK